jgi:hypothetical protein
MVSDLKLFAKLFYAEARFENDQKENSESDFGHFLTDLLTRLCMEL